MPIPHSEHVTPLIKLTIGRLPMPFAPVASLRFLAIAGFVSLLVGCATPVGEVEAWPVTAAEKQQFTATVIDIQCELTGNCANECGEGKRQLGLKSQDGELGTVLVAKNLSNYTGAAEELWRYCQQQVEVNGLFTENKGVRFFQLQNVRVDNGEWKRANRYLNTWAERYGKTPQQTKNWQEHDDRVQTIIERDGRLGLGEQADQDYFK